MKIMATSNKSQTAKKNNFKEQITAYFNEHTKGSYNYKQVAVALGINGRSNQYMVADILDELTESGFLLELVPGKYQSAEITSSTEGTFVRRSNGKNSVIIENSDVPIFVAERNSMHALNGDRVKVLLCAQRRGSEPEAKVVEIVEKKDQKFIGTLKVNKNFAFLCTDSKFLACDIFIPKDKLKGGQTGDKAIVKIVQWNDDDKNPIGEVVDIFGRTGENNSEMNAILAEFNLPYKYPKKVEDAANRINTGITPEEIAKREDFRKVTTFTIDPRDAKDFDDALSIRRLDNGNWEVGVHIADVTHYVHPGTIIDKEAESRATSVYLVDRTVPMLPERLCNDICSLRPNEEKLAFSCIFEMNGQAHIFNHRIARTVIESDRRFTYEEAQQIIETGEGDFAEELLTLDKMAKALRKRRFDNGAVNFDRLEVRFEIDETGHPISVYFKESKDANKLIEEFMLLANKQVATDIGKTGNSKKKAKPFVYRIHDNPDPDKMSNFAEIASRFGYKIRTKGKASEVNSSLNKMLDKVKGHAEENLLSILAIRSMAKAVYSTVNIGHYGLAFDYYTHFTSPIRRYPDMMVHRLLDRYLNGGRAVNQSKLEEECKHSSDMEQLAANAERASIKYKQVEFMADRLGKVYEGSVSGVTEWGLYVELDENKCEGMVPIRDLVDDYYEFDEKNYCLIGRRYRHIYRLGDKLTVQVARADLNRKQLDFALVDGDGNVPAVTVDKNGNVAKPKKESKKAESKRRKKDTGNPASKRRSGASKKRR